MASFNLHYLYSLSLLLLLLLLLLLPFLSTVFSLNCMINFNASLSSGDANAYWLSPNEEFAFGFRSLPSNKNLFLLAIWFHKIPDTIVWSANPNSPVLPGSTVQLTSEGKLELLNPNNSKVWVRPTNQAKPICGAMNDNGNFVVLDEANNVIWQSFQEPTDTILPGQSLGTPSTLTSRLAPDDYRDGHFGLVLQEDGNLVLYYNAKVTGTIALPYWATETIKNNALYNFVYDVNGHIFLQDGVKIIYRFTENVAGLSQDFYHMARMDFNGIFAQYRYPKSCNCNGNWSVVHKIPTDICMAISPESSCVDCGFNSYSFIINGEPDCLCLENYSYLNRSDHYRGCRPNFQLPSCQPEGWEANQELVNFIQYDNMDWSPSNYDAPAGSSVDSHTCKQLCLNDCFCAVAVFDGKRCWKKKYPLSNGRKSSSLNKTTFVKVPMKEALVSVKERCKNHDKSTLLLVISVLLGSSVFLNFLLILAMSLAVFLYNKKLFNFSSVSSVSEVNVKRYSYKELEEETGGFKQILGKGAFGTVYKGVLESDPRRFVAVKKLDKLAQEGEKEFKTEVSVIGQTHHKNLVRLLGYCDEEEHRLLVYEYMSNGSLASCLFGITRPDWNQRVQIAVGIARGLMYLHEECSSQIIHCDIKPQNILLDEFFTPRIADFGLAKLLLAEQTLAARTNIRGTVGYFAPEWFKKASITVKVDVYSFGVMLLEIICCKSSVVFGSGDQEEALIDWIYECYCKKKLNKLVENDEEAKNDMKRLERVVMVAIWCIQEDPSQRPSMKKVTQMLEGVTLVSVPPSPSSFSSI